MASRDQQRAALAYDHVSRYLDANGGTKASAKKYATIVHKMPALLQSAGLCQALHFAESRKDEDQRAYVGHLAAQLSPCLGLDKPLDGKQLLDRVRRASLPEYLVLTDEAMACAAWYRRLVQGVLKIDHAEADQGDG